MANRHTPGPWHVEPVSYPERAHPQVYAGKKLVADPRNSKTVPAPESDYNAHLIAAAPDLLSAVEQAITAMVQLGNMLNWPPEIPQSYADTHNALRAARDKARGDIPEQG